MSEPVKTRCGHRFCGKCIQPVFQSKNASCPLCNCVLQRRSLSKDEHVEIYTSRLQKLIEAIEKDCGSNVLLYTTRPRSTRESCSSENSVRQKFGSEEHNQPSCSYANPKALKKPSSSQTNRNAQKKQRRSKQDKVKIPSTLERKDIRTYYFQQYSQSGVEPLPSDDPDYESDKSKGGKVQRWLETLQNDEFDDLNRIVPVVNNLDDTVICSVSQDNVNKAVTPDHKFMCPTNIIDENYSRDVPSRRSSRDRKSEGDPGRTIETDEPRRTSGTSSRKSSGTSNRKTSDTNNKNRQVSPIDQRPSTSGIAKSKDIGRDRILQEHNQDRIVDVHRTSPCDLLPTAKKNWSSVAQFGKELRSKRRKKIKSLDVSIETKSKKSLNKSVSGEAAQTREPSTRSTTEGTSKRQVAVDNEPSEKRRVFKEVEEHRSRVKSNGSMSEEAQPARESSFITLEEGKHVHIKSLNNHQMNDIIGIVKTDEDFCKSEIENVPRSDEEPDEQFIKRSDLCQTPPLDRSRRSLNEVIHGLKVRAEAQDNSGSPDLLAGHVSPPESVGRSDNRPCSTSTFQSSTPRSNRLSLKRRSTDPKSSVSADTNDVSRLRYVKRDLNREIDRTAGENVGETAARLTSGMKDKPKERNGEGGNVDDLLAGPRGPKANKPQGRNPVIFKKLGKVMKRRRKPVSFLYLGSTRRSLEMKDYIPRLEKPCNPVTVSSPVEHRSENSFGNYTRIPVNVMVEQDKDTSAAMDKEVTTNVGKTQFNPVAPVSSIPKATPTKEVESNKNIVSTTGVSQLRDSEDILFVSLYETQEYQANTSKRPIPEGTSYNDTVKILSPRKDSLLKFLSLESPTTDPLKASKFAQQGDKEPVAKRSSFSGVRGEHSRALIKRSQQGSEVSQIEASPSKKRKRSLSRDKLDQRMKRVPMIVDQTKGEVDSCQTLSSETTYTKNSGKSKTEASDGDTDAEVGEKSMNKHRRACRRIISEASSDTEGTVDLCASSPQNTNVANVAPVRCSPTSKRKRTVSPDSDSYDDVKAILSNWSNEKRIDDIVKLPSYHSSAIRNSMADTRRRHLLRMDVESNPKPSSDPRRRDSSENRAAFDDDSPDFGATIDKITDIRNSGRTTVADKLSERQRNNIMQDNFDEIIANVDTEALIGNYSWNTESKGDSLPMKCSAKNEQGFREKCKESERPQDPGNDHDKTLTPERVNVANRSSKMRDDRLRMKTIESTREEATGRNVNANRSSTINPALRDNDKVAGGPVIAPTLEETCFDHDSLMNITQHQLLIKQFEDDLFAKSGWQTARKNTIEQQTPPRLKNVKQKDAEHSGEEDDIVENTPEVKTKNHSSNSANDFSIQAVSSGKESSTTTPVMRQNGRSAVKTPSSTDDTSTISRTINPLYQSTPKLEVQRKAARTKEKMLKPGPETDKSTKDKIRPLGVQSLNRQRLCFVCSGLLLDQIKQVQRLAGEVNARYVTKFDREVTHVIVKADETNNGASKTLKYLQGVAYRKWIVGFQWVIDSLTEKKLISEERYEVVDCTTLEAGPRNSRLRQKDLFEGFVFLCVEPYVDVSVEQYQELLRATGATVVHSFDALAAVKTNLKIIMTQGDIYDHELIQWHRKTRGVPVVHDWVVECISQYKLVSFYPYLQELSQQDVLALGFPEFLVEEEPDEDSDSMGDVST
ncbi:Breast cancer type 1 susceptibility protein like protein [Dufourea novaeangliae]|uniref:Breast cancer type 1 susceptibility protein like protein n=1 Tax=Dufourea novaeangliae TaxID=178035 RepID=A0A154PP07_DUFNO|nr:Breast cancer type 1 susceptibility protein like protein [Dufourea novaeangliae]